MIVHYFQPHRPYIADALPAERAVTDIEDQPWAALRNGADKETVWELYLDNLRIALQSIQRLLENTAAETVVITADHGDLFGELGQYGHPEGVAHPNLKKVPWVETTATDKRTSTPQVDVERQETTVKVEDQLQHLGYL
jgi:membrane-anchored protein YejM (alkaline phosphatase superfamily)